MFLQEQKTAKEITQSVNRNYVQVFSQIKFDLNDKFTSDFVVRSLVTMHGVSKWKTRLTSLDGSHMA